MSPEFLKALEAWVGSGNRCVDIQFNNQGIEGVRLKVWCYSYDHGGGFHATKISEIPTDKDILRRQIKHKEEEMARLKRQLE